jgi:hypothetical protein
MVDVEDNQDNDETIILLMHSGFVHANNNWVFLGDAHLLGIINSRDDGVDHIMDKSSQYWRLKMLRHHHILHKMV